VFPELQECAAALPRNRNEYEKIADGNLYIGADLTLFSSLVEEVSKHGFPGPDSSEQIPTETCGTSKLVNCLHK
jgi:hypothetical protein